MHKINLLPYRKARKEALLKRFYVFLGFGAGLSVAIIAIVHAFFSLQISGQEQRITFLKSEINTLENQIKDINKLKGDTQALLARKRVVEDLQANRSRIVMLMNHLSQSGDGIEIAKLSSNDKGVLTIDGTAASNPHVSSFLKHLEAADILSNATLISTESKQAATGAKTGSSSAVKFIVTASLLNLSQKKSQTTKPMSGNKSIPSTAAKSSGDPHPASAPAASVQTPAASGKSSSTITVNINKDKAESLPIPKTEAPSASSKRGFKHK